MKQRLEAKQQHNQLISLIEYTCKQMNVEVIML